MKRRSPAVFAAIVVLGVGLLAYKDAGVRKRLAKLEAESARKAEYAATAALDEEKSAKAEPEIDALVPTPEAETVPSGDRFSLLPDGSAVPPLPSSAPTKVKLGVVLFRYLGAQVPPKSERSRKEAEKLALEAVALAKTDFAAAVKTGDQGSDENVGWMSRGLLESGVEHAVFSLEKGAVSPEPIDTPRGYWVVKRLR